MEIGSYEIRPKDAFGANLSFTLPLNWKPKKIVVFVERKRRVLRCGMWKRNCTSSHSQTHSVRPSTRSSAPTLTSWARMMQHLSLHLFCFLSGSYGGKICFDNQALFKKKNLKNAFDFKHNVRRKKKKPCTISFSKVLNSPEGYLYDLCSTIYFLCRLFLSLYKKDLYSSNFVM